MVGDVQIIWLIVLLVLIVVFGVLSHFLLKMDDMEVKTKGFKILKAITFTATFAVGLALVIMVRQNADSIEEILHR